MGKNNKMAFIAISLQVFCQMFKKKNVRNGYGSFNFPLTYNGKSKNWNLLLAHCRCLDKMFTEMFLV